MKQIKLNIGCGDNKIKGFINIDGFAGIKPDVVHDITQSPLPFKKETVDEIVFFHCIEHIQESLHDRVLGEFFRILKKGGKFIISYPEFLKCVERYKDNFKGERKFFKATIYGRQSHPGDFHVSLMDTQFFRQILKKIGFKIVKIVEESDSNPWNTVIYCIKDKRWTTREELLRAEIFNK
jgi:predicted SAM-dependent methyltransferase